MKGRYVVTAAWGDEVGRSDDFAGAVVALLDAHDRGFSSLAMFNEDACDGAPDSTNRTGLTENEQIVIEALGVV